MFEVKATNGDTYLGGEDFDNKIIDWLAEGFIADHNIDLRKDKMAMQRYARPPKKQNTNSLALKQISIFLSFAQTRPALNISTSLTRDR